MAVNTLGKARNLVRNPFFRFLAVSCILLGVFYLFWSTDFYTEVVLTSWNRFQAWLCAGILSIFYSELTWEGEVLFSPEFSMSINRGCDALEAIVCFISVTISFPVPAVARVRGLAIGILVLVLLNIFRILTLFWAGTISNEFFELLHIEIWQPVFIVLAALLWIVWAIKAAKKNEIQEDKAG